MKVHMYEDVPNFGDVLNKYLWPVYFKKYLDRQDDILMFGIGTLLGSKIDHQGRVIVCGSGCGYGSQVDDSVKNMTRIFFVRGPLSAQMLQMPEMAGITDPAILTPEVFPAGPKNGKVIFVPHWETSRNPLWKRACQAAGIDYVDPMDDISKIMAAISGARLVIAEAMHAAIIADAYRVPWVPVSTSARINQFKWHDWAASLGMKPVFNFLTPLGMSDKFRNMTGKNRSLSLEKVNIEHQLAVTAQKSKIKDGLKAFTRFFYVTLVPKTLRDRKDHHLLWTVGPALDAVSGVFAGIGIGTQPINRAAEELKRLSGHAGMLSDETLAEKQRARLKEKFEDVKAYLDAA